MKIISQTTQQPLLHKKFALAFLFIAIVGILDAGYLTLKHFTGGTLPCAVGGNCEYVTTSSFSTLFGIPISLFGLLYYLTFAIISARFLDTKNNRNLLILSYLSFSGFVVSLFLLGVQAFVLNAYCLYCLLSATLSTLLFVIGLRFIFINKNAEAI